MNRITLQCRWTLRRFLWSTMVVLAVLIALYALTTALVPSLRPPFVAALFADKGLRAFGHLVFGGIALATGALQFSNRLRNNRPYTHRLIGRIYLVMVLVSSISALLLALSSSGGLVAHFGFGMLAVLWFGTSTVAYVRVLAADYASHREWMIRSYALCLAAVTLRIYLPLSAIAGVPFDDFYPVVSWLCWVPNLVVAEWFFVRGRFVPLAPVGHPPRTSEV